MLVSENDDEQQLALALITAIPPLKRDEQVTAALTSLCAQSTKPELQTRVCDAVKSSKNVQIRQNQPATTVTSGTGPVVSIQIASENQRPDAEKLRFKLSQDNFKAVEIELVKPPIVTVHTYLRFFSASSAIEAARIADEMNALKYKSVGIQDFSAYTEKPQSSLEVWIGSSQGKI